MRTTIGTAAAPPVADLRGVVHELIEAGRDEVVELHLADRPLPGERRADADAEHRALGERRVDDAIAELLEQRPQQQKRVAVLPADVLAVDEDARIGAQRVADAEHHGLEERAALRDRTAGRRLRAPAAPRLSSMARAARRLEHLDRAARGGSSANTPSPALAASGHGASITACASRLDERLAPRS